MLEGGFDERSKFVHIPLGDIHRMSEYFHRVMIKAHLATSHINWKHSGFSPTVAEFGAFPIQLPLKDCPGFVMMDGHNVAPVTPVENLNALAVAAVSSK